MSREEWDELSEHRRAGTAPPVRGDRPSVLVAIRDLPFHQEVLDFLERDPRIQVAGAATDPSALRGLLARGGVDVVVSCSTLGPDLRHPASGAAGVPLVIVAEDLTVPVLREAIDAAARGVFAWPDERAELAGVLAGMVGAIQPGTRPRGTVVAVTGSRGGAGTTFLATHLAATLADRSVRTVLVDLDVDFAGLTVALGIDTEASPRTVTDLLPVLHELAPEHVEATLYEHPRGFAALLAPPDLDIEAGDRRAIPPGLYRACIALLAGSFDAVVLHVPRSVDEVARAGVELADHVLLTTTLDLFSLYGARRALAGLGLKPGSERCRVVINGRSRSEVTPVDVARILGARPAAAIRPDPAIPRVQDRGELLPRRSRKAGRDLRTLAQAIVPPPAGARLRGKGE